MSELKSALDAHAAEDLKPLFGGQLLDRLAPLLQAHNQLAAEIARTVRECELTQAPERDGLTSMQSWLVGHGLLSKGDAERFVRAGRVGERMPAVAAAASEGSVTSAKVVEIGRKLTPARLAAAVEQGHDLAEVDGAVALVAATQTHEKLVEFVASYAAAVDPDGPEPDPTEGRRFWLSRGEHGWDFGGHLDPVAGEKVATAVESIVQADRPKGDDRTRSQQNADALVQLADDQLASGSASSATTVHHRVTAGAPGAPRAPRSSSDLRGSELQLVAVPVAVADAGERSDVRVQSCAQALGMRAEPLRALIRPGRPHRATTTSAQGPTGPSSVPAPGCGRDHRGTVVSSAAGRPVAVGVHRVGDRSARPVSRRTRRIPCPP